MIAPAIAPAREEGAAAPAPRLVWEVRDDRGPLGALVIDELVAARACGGVRLAASVTPAELGELARVMTLKFAFFGIACGGAKAGLLIPDGATPEERHRRARRFGAALAPLLRFGTYVPGTDLGCTERDLWELTTGAGVPGGTRPAQLGDTSATAGFSGRSAAIAAIAALRGNADGKTLAVLGYGRVGAALAGRFVAAGGRLVAVSTASGAVLHPTGFALARLEELRALHGDEGPLRYPGARRIAAAEMLGIEVDVVAPCGTTGMIGAGDLPLRCRVVASGANAALTFEAERELDRSGVTVVPDFVANAGGVLVSHFWPLRLSDATVDALLERRFHAIVTGLLARADAERVPVPVLARALAMRSFARLARDPSEAVRHERMIARLGRSRLASHLPAGVLARLVLGIARGLGPRGAE